MRTLYILTKFDVNFMVRNRETILWMFIMPVMFMFLIGNMTKSGEGPAGRPRVYVRDADGDVLAAALLRHLDAVGFEVMPTADDSLLAQGRRAILIPPEFTCGALRGDVQTVTFALRTDDVRRRGFDETRVRRAVFRTLGDLLATVGETGAPAEGRADSVSSEAASSGAASWPVAMSRLGERPPAISVEVLSSGFRIPSGFDQAVPGMMVMFILLVLLTTGGVLLVTERESGLLRRLASAPLRRGEIVASKMIARIVVGLVQAAFAMLIGSLLYKVSWGPNLPGVVLVLFLYAVTIAALSLVFGNLARSRGQAVGFGVLASNLMAALGGCWWPIEVVPEFMQKIQLVLPTGWAMQALHKLLYFGEPVQAVVPMLALMAGSALLFSWIAARTFRF